MGEYYAVVCHDCEVIWQPSPMKLVEIERNVKQLAEIGLFLVAHRHHRVDIIGDSGDDGDCNIDMSGYRELAFFEMPAINDGDFRVNITEKSEIDDEK